MTLTKSDIINSIYNQCGFSKRKSTEMVEKVLQAIKQSLESGEDVLISGLGKFSVKEKKERRGRNPQTGDDLTLESRRIVTFGCSPVLRDKLNGRRKDKNR